MNLLASSRRAFFKRLLGISLLASDEIPRLTRASSATQQGIVPVKQANSPDHYAHYIRNSDDFRRVKQEKVWCEKAWPSWTYMPWTYQWSIGYDAASGAWSQTQGYNGAFLDGNGGEPDSPPGKLAWIDRFRLRFYLDHTTGKGDLHLWDGGKQKPFLTLLHGNGNRTRPVNATMRKRLEDRIRTNIDKVRESPVRAAYALDDEVSWGHFTHPAMWKVTDDEDAYRIWLRAVYGERIPERLSWVTYNDYLDYLPTWNIRDFNAGALIDQWTFNDKVWCNFLGDLVEFSNTIDAETPCGIVGGQAPNAFGGYDYARLMRKIQFIEAYNLGSSQSIIRSFNPRNALPTVTSHFHQSVDDDIWQTWHYLAHGNRGHIGWVEGWFDGQKPQGWHAQVAPHYREAADKIGPLLKGAEWRHDNVALYYSHASIQLGWMLDAQAHGKTWINRDGDHRLGASHMVRQAWENMLRDSGHQYNFLSYIDVIQAGVPAEYRVLILPACLCLSDAEAHAIEAFCQRGGTVIADYLPGVWDQHGCGRANGGALDSLFGVRHDPMMTSRDVFGNNSLWCEVNQDVNFGWKTYHEFLTNANSCLKDRSGFNRAVRTMPTDNIRRVGTGTAVLMNLSPQWYNAYRVDGFAAAQQRAAFVKHLSSAGLHRWIEIEGAGAREFGYEITYFRAANGRTVLFLTDNREIVGTEQGGGSAISGKDGSPIPIMLRFTAPVRDVRDERKIRPLGNGTRFGLSWIRNEAIVLSFET